MIDLTPLEVRKKKGDFRRIMRGYDPALVDDFLDLVADRLEQLVRENMALAERTAQQDQQVTEYRDRERALTEALVTAQEMREEIRKQTARETELAKQNAEKEAEHLRAAVQQELGAAQQQVVAAQHEATRVRSMAQREAEEIQATARRDAQELKAAAQREAQELKAAAQRDASQYRSKLTQQHEREEAALRSLRARHQQFLARYRSFLERELNEIGALSSALGVDAASGAAGAAAAGAGLAALTAVEGGELSLDEFASPGDDPDAIDLAFAEPASGADDVGLTDELEPVELEPVELEPIELEPFEPEPIEPEDMPAVTPDLDTSINADEAAAEPIELANAGWAIPQWEGPSIDLAEPPVAIDFGSDIDAPAETQDLEEMSQLLRNAEAAGYRIEGLNEEEEELLLEEELPRPKNDDDDEGWLESLIEDDK